MSTRVLTPSCIAAIVRDVGLDAMLDDLIERLGNAFAAHDPEVIETIMRDGFRYTKPDFGLIEWMPSMETGRRVAIKTVGYHPNNPVERGAPSVLSTTSIHDTNAWVLIALASVHVAAVLFHLLVRRENLVRPMFSGRRPWPEETSPPTLHFAPAWLAVLLFTISLGFVLTTLAYLGK